MKLHNSIKILSVVISTVLSLQASAENLRCLISEATGPARSLKGEHFNIISRGEVKEVQTELSTTRMGKMSSGVLVKDGETLRTDQGSVEFYSNLGGSVLTIENKLTGGGEIYAGAILKSVQQPDGSVFAVYVRGLCE